MTRQMVIVISALVILIIALAALVIYDASGAGGKESKADTKESKADTKGSKADSKGSKADNKADKSKATGDTKGSKADSKAAADNSKPPADNSKAAAADNSKAAADKLDPVKDTKVTIVSVDDLHGEQTPDGRPENVLLGDDSRSIWNPKTRDDHDYVLDFAFDIPAVISHLTVRTPGDFTHDPASIQLYKIADHSQELVQTFTTTPGNHVPQVFELSSPLKAQQVAIKFIPSTEWQVWVNQVKFN